jgi:rSAM-associated Gly-rich repeat protein
MGFEVLTACLFCGITFACLSGHPITDKDMVKVGVRVLNCTGLVPKEYKTWILHGNNASKTNDFVFFKTFWENAVQIAAFTAIPASQHGHGMAVTNDNTLAHLLMDALSNFGTASAATQKSLRSNAPNIMAIQRKLQMLCQAVRTGQPPQQQPQRPQNGRRRGQQCGRNNGGGNGGSNGGGGGYNNGGGGGGYNSGKDGYSSGGSGGWWRQWQQLWQGWWQRRQSDP